MTRNKKWQGKTGGGSFGQKALFFYFKHGSISVAYAIVSVVILLYLIVNYSATKSIYSYFKKRQKYSVFRSILSTYCNHYIFGKTLIDKFAMFAGRRSSYSVEVVGQEYFDAVIQNPNTGAIIINSHVGSTEMAGYFLKQNVKKLHAVVYGGEAAEMQKHRDRILAEHNVEMIPVVDGFSHVFAVHNALKNFDLVSMAGDRVYEGSKNVEVMFLEAPAQFPISAFQLAVKLNVPVLALFVMMSGHKKYTVYVHSITVEHSPETSQQQRIQNYIQAYAAYIECMLELYPLQWFNFYDFWKK